MASRRIDPYEELEEWSAAYEIGEDFAADSGESNSPSDEQFDSLWQAQMAHVREAGEPLDAEQAPVDDSAPVENRVLFIEDDEFAAIDYIPSLRANGFDVLYIKNADEALEVAKSDRHFRAVVIDIRMHHGKFFGAFETVRGLKTGVLLAGELIQHIPEAIFVALTNSRSPDDAEWFEAHEGFGFAIKGDTPPGKFTRLLKRLVFNERPRPFIVHGHDYKALYELKDYLEKALKFKSPIILKDEPTKGKTVIQKLEKYVDEADIIFALFTPDDMVAAPGGQGNSARARQNVIYELGFFHARLGRESGKVIILYKSGVEFPSDLSGVVPIDISGGISAADEEIRRELREYL